MAYKLFILLYKTSRNIIPKPFLVFLMGYVQEIISKLGINACKDDVIMSLDIFIIKNENCMVLVNIFGVIILLSANGEV